MTSYQKIELRTSDDVGHARRRAIQYSRALGLDETEQGRVAITVTEAGTNVIKHGNGGEMLLSATNHGTPSLGVLALDKGPGITDVTSSMRDGESSAGTSGIGLGSIKRQADVFDLFSAPGQGTAVFAQFWPGGKAARTPAGFVLGGVSVPVHGEDLCGDGWTSLEREGRATILVSDGLGHGPLAHDASRTAIDVFERSGQIAPSQIVENMNGGLRSTRGAAAAVVEIASRTGTLRFCGIGNLTACVMENGKQRQMVSHYGTLGHDVRKVQEFQYPWSRDSVLIVNTDGILSQWDLRPYPGLLHKHPMLIAAILYRDFSRGRDDTTVVVAREAR